MSMLKKGAAVAAALVLALTTAGLASPAARADDDTANVD